MRFKVLHVEGKYKLVWERSEIKQVYCVLLGWKKHIYVAKSTVFVSIGQKIVFIFLSGLNSQIFSRILPDQ